MRLILAALCISAYVSTACAQTEPNLDRLSASQPIHGVLAPLTKTKGNLHRRVLPAHSPPVAVVRRPPVPGAVLRQTCILCPKVQKPALLRSSCTVARVAGMAYVAGAPATANRIRFERFTSSPVYCTEGDIMTDARQHEIERRLEQSKRMLKGAADSATTDRIGKMIRELEIEKLLDKEK
jgi:hypothetical protein